MQPLFLEPEDVWLFRDGRPFDAGTSHRARSIFPPYPSALQGTVRSHQLVIQKVNLTDRQAIIDAVGTATDYANLRMRGPFLAKYENDELTRYFPLPADAFPVSEDSAQMVSLKPEERTDGLLTSTSQDTLHLLVFPQDVKSGKREFGEWLTEDDLNAYLSGKPVTPIKSRALFARESRVGVKLNDVSRATEQGMLYVAEFIRPCPGVGMYVEFEGYDPWPSPGILRLGGEGHAARYRKVKATVWPQPPKPLPPHFKVYFASPAYFSQGWEPANWNTFFDGKITLQAVALRGYETIGGYDYAAHGDKPSRRYVPAGSVYYFKAEEPVCLISGLTQNAITQSGAEIGFGQVLITKW